MIYELPALPYDMTALEPHISKETLEYHYGKHHKTYVDNLNKIIPGTEFEGMELEEIIKKSHSKGGPIFNNAAQIWNHTFYWHCLSPNGGGVPSGDLLEKINTAFGSFENFKAKFTESSVKLFGAGWAWLVQNNDGSLEIVETSNAHTPLAHDKGTALMTCDVWEHAYYIDYRNARPKYLEAFWNLVNWNFVESNLTN